MNKKIWNIREPDSAKAKLISSVLAVSELTAVLLCVRGQDTPEKARAFLNAAGTEFHDPFLLKDMDKAVARIRKAQESGERVCIYGDYDVDGVTATMVLYKYLTSLSMTCTYFIPERISEGYGLNKTTIARLAETNDLLITVDTGITAVDEIEYAKSLGLDVIVTDHHSCRPVLPEAYAVVNPHRPDCDYPFKALAGVGVVFKLVCALAGKENTEKVCREYADVVALGTIADVMPISDENRRIASDGIAGLAHTSNAGLRELMTCAGIMKNGYPVRKITSSTVGFIIAPRINAAGRITNASMAVGLLLSDDPVSSHETAMKLCDINKQRQTTESEIYDQACEQISKEGMKNDNVLVLASDGWHQGVIGVVSSKITERYATPSILFSFDKNIGKGSGRSIKGFNLMEALAYCEDLLIEYGGHELAAGLSIERSKLDEFRKRINAYSVGKLNRDKALTLDIDSRVCFGDIKISQAREIKQLEPFGLQNPDPLLMLEDAVIESIIPVFAGKHTKLVVSDGADSRVNAIMFGCHTASFPFAQGDRADIVFNMDINEYGGSESVQMLVKDICLTHEISEQSEAEKASYRDRWTSPVKDVPSVGDFRDAYKALSQYQHTASDIAVLSRKIHISSGACIGYCRLRIILDVLAETGLAECEYDGDNVRITFCRFNGKINLETSEILKNLKK